MKKNVHLQMFRGIGIIIIVLFHAQLFVPIRYMEDIHEALSLGNAVEILFLLSGFLMGKSLLNHIDEIDLVYVVKYYLRRVNRLFFPLIFWSTITLLLGKNIVSNLQWFGTMHELVWWFLSNLFMVSNFYNWGHENALGYVWAVSAEMQFFIIIPLILCFAKKKYRYILAVALIIMSIDSLYPPNFAWMNRWHAMIIGLFLYELTKVDAYIFLKEYLSNITGIKRFILFFTPIIIGLSLGKSLYYMGLVNNIFITLPYCIPLLMCIELNENIKLNFVEKIFAKIGDFHTLCIYAIFQYFQ